MAQVISYYNHEAVIAEYIRLRESHAAPPPARCRLRLRSMKPTAQHWENMQLKRDRQRREKAAARARLFWSADLSLPPNTK